MRTSRPFFARLAIVASLAVAAGCGGSGGAGGAAPRNFVPLIGDWNADGTDTDGVYDPASGVFFLKNTHTSAAADVTFTYAPVP